MKSPWKRVRDYFLKDIWAVDRSTLSRTEALFLDSTRLVTVILKDLLSGQITFWAMGLVYTTLLSLVPLLAVSFSVLKAFEVQNKLEPFLLDMLAPLGPNAALLAQRIVEFVDNMKVGVLGTVGLALLMFTVISLIQKIEESFNTIWRVRGARSVLQRFSDYLSVVLVGPVLVVSALALTASLSSTTVVQRLIALEPFGMIVAQAGKLIPYVLVCAAFTFFYMFIPNTRVRFMPALAGGIIGGVLWETVGWGFASFIVSSTRYTAIYSSFAILVLFMIWVYVSWLILLIGAEISFYIQNPHLLSIESWKLFRNTRLIEQAALSIMVLIASHFYHDQPPWTGNKLLQRLGLDIATVEDILEALKRKRLIIETAEDPPAYVPARDIDKILLQEIYDSVRWHDFDAETGRQGIVPVEAVDALFRELDQAIGNTLKTRSVKDIIRSFEAEQI